MQPNNGHVDIDPGSVTLRWSEATGASSYDVYLDTEDAPTTVVATDLTDTTTVVTGLAHGTVYHWNVVAHSSVCAETQTSPVFRFETCADGKCNFTDDFSDGEAADWLESGAGTKAVTDGALEITGDKKLKVMSPADPIKNGTIEMRLAFRDGLRHEGHILFRVAGKNSADLAILADKSQDLAASLFFVPAKEVKFASCLMPREQAFAQIGCGGCG